MLSHFEARLATVLSARLDAPFDGRVFVAPGPSGGPDLPSLLVRVSTAEILAADFGAGRPQVVPGANDPRRVLRMHCTVQIEARPSTAGGRAERMAALDAVLYELDAPDLRDATALDAPGDPGFQLSGQAPVSVSTEPGDEPASVLLTAEGWFWPPNAPGITGTPITATPLRAAILPVSLEPWPLDLRVGDPSTPLHVRVTSDVDAIALRLAGVAAGQLTGGTAGAGNARIIPLANDIASFQYVPPAAPATDHLVVAMDGLELARFELAVRP